MDLENKTSNKGHGKRTLGKALGIGFLVVGVGAASIIGYKLYEDGVINQRSIVTLYKKVMSNLPFKKSGYNPVGRRYVSPASKGSGSSSKTDLVDELASDYEVLPNIKMKDILGKNVKEFYETTDSEDVVLEITKGAVREITKETLKTGAEAVDELSNYIKSPKAREEALETAKETVQEVFGSPEVREAASELGKSLKSLFGK